VSKIDVKHLLRSIETQMRANYRPPYHLLRKMNGNSALDKEMMGYMLKGGEGGAYYHWLALMTRLMRPRRVLELGNRFGNSTIMIYSELPPGSQLISVDLVRDQRYIPSEIWRDRRVRFVFGDCLDLGIYEDKIPMDVDCLWTDTIHTYQQVKDEFDVYEPLLANEALIVIDDIRLGDKRRFFEEAPYSKYDLTALCHVSGFGILHFARRSSGSASTQTRLARAALTSARIWKRKHDAISSQMRKTPTGQRLTKIPGRLNRFLPSMYRNIVNKLR